MRYLVALTALLLIAISAAAVIAPEHVLSVILSWPSETRFHTAVGIRFILGLTFLLGARSCRSPMIVYAIGVVAFVSAVGLVGLGSGRVDAIIQWWSARPPFLTRVASLGGVLIGALAWHGALGGVHASRTV